MADSLSRGSHMGGTVGSNQSKISTPSTNNVPLTDWLAEILEEVGLSQFHSKLTDDLQLTRLSHFDFVSEDDLINIGMSRPAAKRLLASIRKKKSLVTAIKNKIVNKLLPLTNHASTRKTSSPNLAGLSLDTSSSRSASPSSLSFLNTHNTNNNKGNRQQNRDNHQSGQLTCLINSQDVQIKEQIGHGVHGVVKKGLWSTPNGGCIEVALKILKNDILPPTSQQSTASKTTQVDSFSDFVKEINVMHKLNHPYLIKLYGVVLSTPMMMVTELAPYGNVRDKLRKENGRTPISLLINFGVQIASGMEYLESKRLVHRDLATRNIFISHNRKIKIGDFGLMRAIPLQEEHYIMNETTRIPFPWCAPESLKLKLFSSASDTFMYAVTMWEMFSFGKEPWANLSGSEILAKIDKGERLAQPPACQPTIYQILLQCWDTDPSNRPTFSALMNYISTSYPLEVKVIKPLTMENSDQFYPPLNPSTKFDEDLVSVSSNKTSVERRNYLMCELDDRILVIDGQPENYWWKGQNQRSFEIGWFPLNITQWMAPKKGQHYISKPLKNSFIHTGHSGPDGIWGDPRSIDPMYLKNPLTPFQYNGNVNEQLPAIKLKTRSKLSRLFGINEPSSNNCSQPLSDQKSYHKLFNDNVTRTSKRKLFHNIQRSQSQDIPTKGKGKDPHPKVHTKEEPPLIDFSDEIQIAANVTTTTNKIPNHIPPPIPPGPGVLSAGGLKPSKSHESIHRHLSDTNLQVFGDRYYNVSQTGSWNTGTFEDGYSCSENYSKYYCPQDAVVATGSTPDPEAYHYYSAVPPSNVSNDHTSLMPGLIRNQLDTTSQFTQNSTTAMNASSLANADTASNIISQTYTSIIIENTPSQHNFPVTFDDNSSFEPTKPLESLTTITKNSINSTESSTTTNMTTDINNMINTNTSTDTTQFIFRSDPPATTNQRQHVDNNTVLDPSDSLASSSMMNEPLQAPAYNQNTPVSNHQIKQLSKEFIKTLEDELGISPGCSPGGNAIEGARRLGQSGRSSANSGGATIVVPLPPPPSVHGHSRQSATTSTTKTSQVAIVAPSMLPSRSNHDNQNRSQQILDGISSSREQRLVAIIQKRCAGDVSVQTSLDALRRNNLDHELAIREIQVNRLMSLQITKDKIRCERALIASNWKLESAASRLLDETL